MFYEETACRILHSHIMLIGQDEQKVTVYGSLAETEELQEEREDL